MPCWTFPWPAVTTNHLYEGMGRHRRLTPKAAAWRDEAILIIRQWHAARRLPLQLPDGKLRFELRFWPPRDGRKHDPSNLLKLSEDSVFAAFLVDDGRIWESCSRRQDRSDTPRVVVTVEPLMEGN